MSESKPEKKPAASTWTVEPAAPPQTPPDPAERPGLRRLSHALHALAELHGDRSTGKSDRLDELVGLPGRVEACYLRLPRAGTDSLLLAAADCMTGSKELAVAARDFEAAARHRDVADALNRVVESLRAQAAREGGV